MIPNRETIAARAMRGEALEIPVWVKRRGRDQAQAVLQQWRFNVNEPGEELTIYLDERGAPAPAPTTEKEPMIPEDYAMKCKEEQELAVHKLAMHKLNAREMRRANKEARKMTLLENTQTVRHKHDVGWTLLASITTIAGTILALFDKLPW